MRENRLTRRCLRKRKVRMIYKGELKELSHRLALASGSCTSPGCNDPIVCRTMPAVFRLAVLRIETRRHMSLLLEHSPGRCVAHEPRSKDRYVPQDRLQARRDDAFVALRRSYTFSVGFASTTRSLRFRLPANHCDHESRRSICTCRNAVPLDDLRKEHLALMMTVVTLNGAWLYECCWATSSYNEVRLRLPK